MYVKNKDFFSEPNPLNSYWAGFIAADGCVARNDVLIIRLTNSDVNHLEKFKEDIEFSGPIKTYQPHSKTYNSKLCSSINICAAKKINQDLYDNFNITPAKTLTLRPPNLIHDDHILAFIAGYIDGDGCIRIGNKREITPYIEILGTEAFLNWIRDWCDYKWGSIKTSKAAVRKNNSYFTYVVMSSRAVMFNDEVRQLDLPLMKRKWDKFNVCKQRLQLPIFSP